MKIFQILQENPPWVLRGIKNSDLKTLEWGNHFKRYRKLMRLSFEDHQAGKKVYLVAEMEGKIAGQIVIDWRILVDKEKSDGVERAYLYSLRVFPPYRNKGLGTKMILFCENFLKERNFKFVTIACERKNLRALKLYERLRFKIFKQEDTPWEFFDDQGKLRKITEPEWVLQKCIM
ncbi:GNAT family N-acetyltransferase [Candidatus Microgenomates bacterium]|nr:GNAT family N-acetyltransferase [Candidatus Microgenomates bacterium]